MRKQDIIAAYKEFFNTPNGRVILHDMMRVGHVFQMARTKNSHEMAFVEGERNMALYVLKMADVSQGDLRELVVEAKTYKPNAGEVNNGSRSYGRG